MKEMQVGNLENSNPVKYTKILIMNLSKPVTLISIIILILITACLYVEAMISNLECEHILKPDKFRNSQFES